MQPTAARNSSELVAWLKIDVSACVAADFCAALTQIEVAEVQLRLTTHPNAVCACHIRRFDAGQGNRCDGHIIRAGDVPSAHRLVLIGVKD